MVTEVTFRGWRRPAIGALVQTVEGGRPVVSATVEARGVDADGNVTRTEPVRLTSQLTGPGDVTGLQAGAVGRRFPTPGATDAETTKCPFVEFSDPGLPWRYTPRRTPAAADRQLRPWLALVVGTDDEVDITGDLVTLAESVLRAHRISGSPALAHVHESGGTLLARVLSRRALRPGTRYTAVVVPTFVVADGELANAWSSPPQGPVRLPVLTRWRFRTGPGGDFRTLAAQLKPGSAGQTTGLAPLRYPRRPDAPPLRIGGALTAAGGPPTEPLPEVIRADLARLRTRETDQAGRRIVGLPRYGDAWHEDSDTTVWGATLNSDPRHRGVAGLGGRLGVELQEELADLATRHAGALDVAAERVRHLAWGLAAAGGLWRRRLPTDPGRRLWLLGPALKRVPTEAGTVEARATADDRPLPPGWFSPAARRVLRRGPARTGLAQPQATDPAQLNVAANRPPPPPAFLEAGLASFAAGAPDFEDRRAAVARGTVPPTDRVLGARIASLSMERFPRHTVQLTAVRNRAAAAVQAGRPLPWVQLSLLLTSIGDGEDDPIFDEDRAAPLIRDLADAFDDVVDEPTVVPDLMRDLGDRPEAPLPSVPLDLARLAQDLTAAFDPAAAEGSARRRILGGITGLDPARALEPPEACPGFDLPAWRHLAAMEPDWLLPGIGQLQENSVNAVGTNPTFVDAFLAGLNTRLLDELRWRNLRVTSGCTPIRTFWCRADDSTGDRVDDIRGLRNWNDVSGLGDPQHRPGGLSGADLVLVFRGHLFDRYPNTLLYLVSARHDGEPDFTRPPADSAPRTLPTFQGRIGTDVTLFGFVGVPPSSIDSQWVALEEPPSSVQFRNDVSAANTAGDGALFADLAFDDPTRVLIQGIRLVPGGSP